MNAAEKVYLGDGVYIPFDGYALVLTTENGIAETNRIVLEPAVYLALDRFVDHIDPPRQAFPHAR